MIFPFFRGQTWYLDNRGTLSALDLDGRGLSGTVLILVRERCVFGRFTPPPGLTGGRAMAAARLHAQTAAPFRRSGVLLTRRDARFGLWWWDQEWVDQQLETRQLGEMRVLPEAFIQPAGEGDRLIRSGDGQSAQIWDRGLLVADSWARQAFGTQAWADFSHQAYDDGASGPLPTLQVLPQISNSAYRNTIVSNLRPETWVRGGLAAVMIGLLAATAYFTGQSLRYDDLAAKAAADLARSASRRHDASAERIQAATRDLIAVKKEISPADPLALLSAAQHIIEPFGYKLDAFDVDHDHIRIDLPAEAAVGIDIIAVELEASPYFRDVKPSLDKSRGVLTIDMAAQHAGEAKVPPTANPPFQG